MVGALRTGQAALMVHNCVMPVPKETERDALYPIVLEDHPAQSHLCAGAKTIDTRAGKLRWSGWHERLTSAARARIEDDK